MIELAALGTVLMTSLLGSLHCAGMCGPLAAVASAPVRTHLPVLPSCAATPVGALHYNAGRLAAYVTLGMLAGGAGALAEFGGAAVGIQGAAIALASVALVAMGAHGLWRWAHGSRAGATPPAPARWAARLHGKRSFPAGLGVLTGLMPCGWLWANVVVAGGAGSPLAGALVMATFWVGTVPALAIVGIGLAKLGRRAGHHLRWAVPLLMLAAGGTTLVIRGPQLWNQVLAPTSATTGASCH